MLESSISYIITRTFPESIILVLSGMILLNKEINLVDVFKKGILLGIVIGMVRFLPITFGVHSIIGMLILGALLYKISGNDIKNSVMSTCLIWIALVISEGIYVMIATSVLKIDMDILMDNQTVSGAMATLPSLIILLVLIILIKQVVEKIKIKVGD